MRNLGKYISISILLILFLFVIYKVARFFENKELGGEIEIVSNEENYNYLKDSAEDFMKINKKINVTVEKCDNEGILGYLNKETNVEEPNIIILDSKTLRNLNLDNIEKINYSNDIIESYNKNFNSWRLNEIKNGKNYLAIPIQNNPQFLLIREDILNQYGYRSEDIRTWKELTDLCKDIRSKYDKQVDLFSYDLSAIEDIEKLVLYQGGTINQKEELINIIKGDNLMGKGVPLCYIANKNNYDWIINNNSEDSLKAIMIPAIVIGGNRAVAFDGDNAVMMKGNDEKQEIINKFLTFLIDNQSRIDETFINKEGFFPSSRAFYNNIIIDAEFDKINNQKLLSLMTNIANRIPDRIDYEELDYILDESK